MWEQRYCILKPKRSETNIRTYDDDDLKHLLNVSLLNQHNYKISKIAKLSPAEINEAILKLTGQNDEYPHQINGLTAAMVEMNEERFDKILTTIILQKGFEGAVNHLVLPFLQKIGILWQTGQITPAHEHFVSGIIRQKFIVAIDGQAIPTRTDMPRFLLFLPEGELHELGLLYMQYVLRARQMRVLYLSQNLPFADLKAAYEGWRPEYLCTIITASPAGDEVQSYLNQLAKHFPEVTVFLCGYQVQNPDLQLATHLKRLTDMKQFVQEVERLSPHAVLS